MKTAPTLAALLLLLAAAANARAESTCYGRVASGRLEDGVQLPPAGANFEEYSGLGAAAGRTYVHSKVFEIVLAAYAGVAATRPEARFVFAETGWKNGGPLKPHRTHQNGLSVDFMVPVRDAKGRATTVPRNALNRYGYDLEFDAEGRAGDLTIDFEAMAEHIYQLDRVARQEGAGLALVIVDRPYLPKLYATSRGDYLRTKIPFMKGTPWIRHDEHYHVDFAVRCRPLR